MAAKLRTREALLGILEYLQENLPAEVAESGVASRIKSWFIGRSDPEALERYDALMIATIPERGGAIGDEMTATIPIDICLCVQATNEEDAVQRQIAYGDGVINLWQEDSTFGGAVLTSTAHNPEISLPSPGAKGIGCTFVRLHIELNLLGG